MLEGGVTEASICPCLQPPAPCWAAVSVLLQGTPHPSPALPVPTVPLILPRLLSCRALLGVLTVSVVQSV